MKRALAAVFIPVGVLVLIGWLWFKWFISLEPLALAERYVTELPVTKKENNTYVCGNSWLRMNRPGLYDLYTSGAPYERGVAIGKLTKEQIRNQEKAFTEQLMKMIPSKNYLQLLNYLVLLFNHNLDASVPREYLEEIYGVSRSASQEFSYIGENYQRLLNYHAAHDIGHMVQGYHLVGCTSFGAWGSKTADSTLFIARNFDFYAGDDFAKEKIVAFYAPDSGYNFMMITWGGMCGAVSGMNAAGLTVTINAARSYIPEQVGTPVALLARRILQYAATIDEALAIARASRTFVSESFLIGAALDNKAAIIEKTPYLTSLLEVNDKDYLVCTNHFQGAELSWDELNQQDISESPSLYRYLRTKQLLTNAPPLTAPAVARILREQRGIDDKDIGMGNEKVVNQLIAHHSVIFQPAAQLAWVSTNPFQLGEYVCYDLNRIFKNKPAPSQCVYLRPELNIPADSFLIRGGMAAYDHYKMLRDSMANALGRADINHAPDTRMLIASNPQYYLVYELAGDYFRLTGNKQAAAGQYKMALQKEIPWANTKHLIQNKLEECR